MATFRPYKPTYGIMPGAEEFGRQMESLQPGVAQNFASENLPFASEPYEIPTLEAPGNLGSNITGTGARFGQFLKANAGRTYFPTGDVDPSQTMPGIYDKYPGIGSGEAALDAQLASVLSPFRHEGGLRKDMPILQAPTYVPQSVAPLPENMAAGIEITPEMLVNPPPPTVWDKLGRKLEDVLPSGFGTSRRAMR